MSKFAKGNPGGPGRPAGNRSAGAAFFDELGSEAAEGTAQDGPRCGAWRQHARGGDRPHPHLAPAAGPADPVEVAADQARARSRHSAGGGGEAMAEVPITPDEGSTVTTVLDAHRRATRWPRSGGRVGRARARFDKARR